MSKQKRQQQTDLEQRVFEYKLRSLKAWKSRSFIVEVNNKTVSRNRHNAMVLTNDPFPTEFSGSDLEVIRKNITGADPQVFSVMEWYSRKRQELATRVQVFNVIAFSEGGANG